MNPIIKVNESLIKSADINKLVLEDNYVIYVESLCNDNFYNSIQEECSNSARKRVLGLSQNQEELYHSYKEKKKNGVPTAILVYYNSNYMYKELLDEMVSDISSYITEISSSSQVTELKDAIRAVTNLLKSILLTDSQADSLYDLAQNLCEPQPGLIENLLDMHKSYILHYRKHDQSISSEFLGLLEKVDNKIRKKFSTNLNCAVGESLTFSSNAEDISKLSYTYVSIITEEKSSICYCGNCYSCVYNLTVSYAHISQFSDIVKSLIADQLNNAQTCADTFSSVSATLYSTQPIWDCYNGGCTGLTIQDSIAKYTPNSQEFSLLYPSTCAGSKTIDPISHLCCPENCKSCKTEATCTACNLEYSLTADYTQCGCKGIAHCLVCKDNLNTCETCESSYIYQSDGSCSKCGDNIGCNSCSSDFSVCYECDTGYYLDNQACVSCETFSKGCIHCRYMFFNEYLICRKCKPYYTLTEAEECAYCNGKTGCAVCDVTGYTCSDCKNGYFLSNNFCNKCSSSFANCEECEIDGAACTKCMKMYTLLPDNSCVRCNGNEHCEMCDSGGQVCKKCVAGMYLKENECRYCQDDFPKCAECSLDSGCITCHADYTLKNGECVPGYQYLYQNHISSTFDETYDSIILTFSHTLQVLNNCSIILNPSILGENPICNFITLRQLKIILGKGWTITNTSDLYLEPTTLTLNGPYYEVPLSVIVTHAAYPNTLNTPPRAIIEGLNNISASCGKLNIIYRSNKSYGAALNTFNYLWSTDIPSDSVSIADPTQPILELTNFSYTSSFTVFLYVSNIFGRSELARYWVAVNTNQFKISVALDTGDSLKIMYDEKVTIQARMLDLCGILGTVTYDWSLNYYVSGLECFMNRCKIEAYQLQPGNVYSLQVLAQITGPSGIYQSTATTILTSEYSRPNAIIVPPIEELHLGLYPDDSLTYNYYSWSLDPNGLDLTYSWSSTVPGYENLGNDFYVSLNQMSIWIASVTEFSLMLTVDNGYKKHSKTMNIKVVKDLDSLISVYFDPNFYSKKFSSSSKFYIWPTFYSNQPTTFQWHVIPQISLRIPNTHYLTFPVYTFNSGSYFFTVVITMNGLNNSAYTRLSINAGASCPANATKFSPLTDIKTSTMLKFYIVGCIDLDWEDLPLKYTFGYSKAPSGRVNYLTTPSYNAEYSFKFSAGRLYGNFLVCDGLNDCTTASSSAVTITKERVRNLKDSTWIYNEYKRDSQMYELPVVISYFLEDDQVPEDLVDMMWSNFTEFINRQNINIHLLMIVESITFQFASHETAKGNYERIEKYIAYANSSLSFIKEIDYDEHFRFRDLANLILDFSFEMPYVILANSLLNTLLGFNGMPASVAYSQTTTHFSMFCVEDLVSQMDSVKFPIGSLEVQVANASIPATSMLEVKAVTFSLGNYSNIFSVTIKSNKALKNNSIVNENSEVILQNGDLLIEVPVIERDLTCIMWSNAEWIEEGCRILGYGNGKATVSITKSGIFTLIAYSSQYFTAPLLIIISVITLTIILAFVFEYLDISQRKISLNSQQAISNIQSAKQDVSISRISFPV